MEEEESFRGLKSHHYGAKLRYVRLSGPERYGRILMIWALGTWLLYAQGPEAVRQNLHLGLSTATNTRWDLSTVRIGCELVRTALGGLPGLLGQWWPEEVGMWGCGDVGMGMYQSCSR